MLLLIDVELLLILLAFVNISASADAILTSNAVISFCIFVILLSAVLRSVSNVVVRVSILLILVSATPILVRISITTSEVSVTAFANSPNVSSIAGALSTKAEIFPSTYVLLVISLPLAGV